MIIITSEITEDSVQIDGRRHIRERHTEIDGLYHDFTWMAEVGQDAEAGLEIRKTRLEEFLIAQELEANATEVEEE